MIEVSHLTKRYGSHTAVDDLSFTVESGHIYGFLGPNGAGKSTTMNIITGCLAATEGKVTIDGNDIFEEPLKAKRLIGYLPELPPLYTDMTPEEYLTFVAKAKGVRRTELKTQVDHACEVSGISDVRTRLIKHLSKGYRQRVGIAQALLGDPKVIILDEPTVGLDPAQIVEIRDLIKSLGSAHTVILSSHILPEVRAVCDEILIISKGRLVACDTPENLESLFRGTVTIDLTVRASEEETRAILGSVEGVTDVKYTDAGNGTANVTVSTGGSEDISEAVFAAFSAAGKPILRMSMAQASLEDVFLELTATKDPAAEGKAAAPASAGSDGAQESFELDENGELVKTRGADETYKLDGKADDSADEPAPETDETASDGEGEEDEK